MPDGFLAAAGALLGLYLVALLALLAFGRREDARALAGFVPDCVILVRRLLGDPRVPRANKIVLALVAAYLFMPFDLVPDFLPGIGQLDDAVLVALALRALVRRAGPELVREHWPGPHKALWLIVPALRGRGCPEMGDAT